MDENPNPSDNRRRRRWAAFALRLGRLLWRQEHRTGDLVTASYDAIGPGYDEAWTAHMQPLTLEMLDRLAPPPGARCVDLACGTGFVTGRLSRRTHQAATGVDASGGMLDQARLKHPACRFVRADALEYLAGLPRGSVDVVTCAWALGYTRPLALIGQIARVLRRGGRVGIIDNTLFSLAGVLWASVLTFAERPAALRHAMKVRFLPHSSVLAGAMRLAGLGVRHAWDGAHAYWAVDGEEAIARLSATGAAAGFELAAADEHREAIFRRFAEILTARGDTARGVRITHRYLGVVGCKP